MTETNVNNIEAALFGDYIQEFTSGWAKVCRQEDFRIRAFHERYDFQEDRLFSVCQDASAYVTEQILKIALVLRDRYNKALENPNFEQRKASCLSLTWESINLLYSRDVGLKGNHSYPKYIRLYAQMLERFGQNGKSPE